MSLDAPMTDDRATVLWEVEQVDREIPPRFHYRLLLEEWTLARQYHLRFHYWERGGGDVFFDVEPVARDELRSMLGG